jgi:hypothetical protein
MALAPSFSNQTARRRGGRRGACSCCMGKTQAWRKEEQAAANQQASGPARICLPVSAQSAPARLRDSKRTRPFFFLRRVVLLSRK